MSTSNNYHNVTPRDLFLLIILDTLEIVNVSFPAALHTTMKTATSPHIFFKKTWPVLYCSFGTEFIEYIISAPKFRKWRKITQLHKLHNGIFHLESISRDYNNSKLHKLHIFRITYNFRIENNIIFVYVYVVFYLCNLCNYYNG